MARQTTRRSNYVIPPKRDLGSGKADPTDLSSALKRLEIQDGKKITNENVEHNNNNNDYNNFHGRKDNVKRVTDKSSSAVCAPRSSHPRASDDRRPQKNHRHRQNNRNAPRQPRRNQRHHNNKHGKNKHQDNANVKNGRVNDSHNKNNDDRHNSKKKVGTNVRRSRNQTRSRFKGRNTESFQPSFDPPAARFVVRHKRYDPSHASNPVMSVRDIVYTPDLFCYEDDDAIYHDLLRELRAATTSSSSEKNNSLFVTWHGDSHLIADDKKQGGKWKQASPTFQAVIAKMENHFKGFHILATRFNWYRDTTDWKPFHHDAAAIKPRFAKTQNVTVAASFGITREVSFQHAAHHDMTINLPLTK